MGGWKHYKEISFALLQIHNLMEWNKHYIKEESSVVVQRTARSYSGWLTWPQAKYKLTVFFDKVPDAVYFFAVAVMDHTIMVEAED